jgi:hypothetical protein
MLTFLGQSLVPGDPILAIISPEEAGNLTPEALHQRRRSRR